MTPSDPNVNSAQFYLPGVKTDITFPWAMLTLNIVYRSVYICSKFLFGSAQLLISYQVFADAFQNVQFTSFFERHSNNTPVRSHTKIPEPHICTQTIPIMLHGSQCGCSILGIIILFIKFVYTKLKILQEIVNRSCQVHKMQSQTDEPYLDLM